MTKKEPLSYLEAGGKLRAQAGKFRREPTTLLMTGGAALSGAGAVLGGLAVRLVTGHCIGNSQASVP